MQLPHLRITIRKMMVAVALAGVLLGGGVEVVRLRKRYKILHQKAAEHARLESIYRSHTAWCTNEIQRAYEYERKAKDREDELSSGKSGRELENLKQSFKIMHKHFTEWAEERKQQRTLYAQKAEWHDGMKQALARAPPGDRGRSSPDDNVAPGTAIRDVPFSLGRKREPNA